jgi:hypothetical protein
MCPHNANYIRYPGQLAILIKKFIPYLASNYNFKAISRDVNNRRNVEKITTS